MKVGDVNAWEKKTLYIIIILLILKDANEKYSVCTKNAGVIH